MPTFSYRALQADGKILVAGTKQKFNDLSRTSKVAVASNKR